MHRCFPFFRREKDGVLSHLHVFDAVQRGVEVVAPGRCPEAIETNGPKTLFFPLLQQLVRVRPLDLNRGLSVLDLRAVEAVALKQGQNYKKKSRVILNLKKEVCCAY